MRTIITIAAVILVFIGMASARSVGQEATSPARSVATETAPEKITQPENCKVLLSAIKEYRVELGSARMKIERFDLSEGRDLNVVTITKVSIPAMKEIVNEMVKSVKDIDDTRLMEEMVAHIQTLSDLLKSQEDNRIDKGGMVNAFNEMEKILNQMANTSQ